MAQESRFFGLAFSTFFASIATFVFGTFILGDCEAVHDAAPAVDPAAARAAFAREVAHARALGLADGGEGGEVVRDRNAAPVHHRFRIASGECGAVVATAWGAGRVAAIFVAPRPTTDETTRPLTAVAADPHPAGQVAHAQWCTRPHDPTELTASIVVAGLEWRPSVEPMTVRWQLLRAPRGALRSALDRGWVLHDGSGNADRGVP
jgi:hypothetical protein